MATYFIADDNGTIYASDIQSEQLAEATLADIISTYESNNETIPEGLEVLTDFTDWDEENPFLPDYMCDHGDEENYSPGNPWDAPGMKISDFIHGVSFF